MYFHLHWVTVPGKSIPTDPDRVQLSVTATPAETTTARSPPMRRTPNGADSAPVRTVVSVSATTASPAPARRKPFPFTFCPYEDGQKKVLGLDQN